MLKLGDPDRVAWKYLSGQAAAILDEDAPFPLEFTPDGRIIPKKLSADFTRWARGRGLDPEDASNDSVYSDPGGFLVLAYSRDGRAIPILRRALHSRNYMIQIAAGKGLGYLKEKSAIPDVVAAAHKAPREVSAVLAEGLLSFDDAYALAEAKKIIADPNRVEMLLKLRRQYPEQAF